jgi:5'-phosphate synthase pdxT subunit
VSPSSAVPPERGEASRLRIGVLASQGDFAAHAETLGSLGGDPVEVRTPEGLADLDGLVIPGGESTTITKAIERDGLEPAIRAHADGGRPILGTCAGMIVCDRDHLGLVDAKAERNAFGRQIASFEAELQVEGLGPDPVRAVFIRAPRIEDFGEDVEILASIDGYPVAIRQGQVVLCSFHPELTDDSRMHALLMALATAARERRQHHESGMRGENDA